MALEVPPKISEVELPIDFAKSFFLKKNHCDHYFVFVKDTQNTRVFYWNKCSFVKITTWSFSHILHLGIILKDHEGNSALMEHEQNNTISIVNLEEGKNLFFMVLYIEPWPITHAKKCFTTELHPRPVHSGDF